MVSSALPPSELSAGRAPATQAAPRIERRWADLLEVAVGFAFIEAALWSGGMLRLTFSLLAMAWILAATFLSCRPLRDLGLGWSGLKQTAIVAPAGALVAGGILLLARSAGTLHGLFGSIPIWQHVLGYVVWALQQQFVAQSFIFARLERALRSDRRAVLATAVLFAIAHIPNSFLVGVTLIGGLIFSELFRRHRNIYPLAVAHALIGLAIAVAMPDQIIHHLRVGVGFLRYRG